MYQVYLIPIHPHPRLDRFDLPTLCGQLIDPNGYGIADWDHDNPDGLDFRQYKPEIHNKFERRERPNYEFETLQDFEAWFAKEYFEKLL